LISNREDWLGQAAQLLAEGVLSEQNIPPLRISVGWPGGSDSDRWTRGECWMRAASEDGVNQIFVSPVHGEDDTANVLACVAHEMIHSIDDCESGHRGAFIRVARSIGFRAPFTGHETRTEALEMRLLDIVDQIGPFPNSAMLIAGRDIGLVADASPKKQATRMIKVLCSACDYTIRTTRKWLDVGLPTCPCGTLMEER
jgi:hypothetical protein